MRKFLQLMAAAQNSVPADKMIFADAEVERVLLANMTGLSHTDYITKDEFAALTNIGQWFYGNTVITSFNELSQSGVTALAYNAFMGCTNLQFIDFTNIISCRWNVMRNCSSLKEIEIGSVFKSSGEMCFTGCTSMTKAIYPSLDFMLNLGWYDTYSPLSSANHLYFATDRDTEVTSINIPEGYTQIKANTFCGAYLDNITMPSTLTSIGANSLRNNIKLTTITIPHAVTSIGTYAFYLDTALASVIYDGTIAECKAITWGTAPFGNCTKMVGKTITCSDGTVSIDSSGNVVTT